MKPKTKKTPIDSHIKLFETHIISYYIHIISYDNQQIYFQYLFKREPIIDLQMLLIIFEENFPNSSTFLFTQGGMWYLYLLFIHQFFQCCKI